MHLEHAKDSNLVPSISTELGSTAQRHSKGWVRCDTLGCHAEMHATHSLNATTAERRKQSAAVSSTEGSEDSRSLATCRPPALTTLAAVAVLR